VARPLHWISRGLSELFQFNR